jgi:hypothetical protein
LITIFCHDVPGNALNKNRRIGRNHRLSINNVSIDDYLNYDIVDSVSVHSYLSIDAYPLIEGKDPPKVGMVPRAIKMPNKKWLTPSSIMVVDTISTVKPRTLLKVLFDPGSTSMLVSHKCLLRHCKTCPIKQESKINTLAGSCKTKEVVAMRNLRLPELDKNRVVNQQKALVFDRHCKYDVILGADFLSKSGIDIKYCTGIIKRFDNELSMRDPHQLDGKEYLAMADILEVQRKAEDIFGMDWYDQTCYASEILDKKYGKVSTDDVVNQLTHLTPDQQDDLKGLFHGFTKVFDGTLGVYPHQKFHIDLIPGAKLKHSQPYAIPRIYLDAFKKKLDRLVQIKVLSPTSASEWGLPTFVTPKNDNTIQ